MELNSKNIEIWSRIGARATFGMVLLELEKKFPNLMVLAADTSTSAGLDRFRKNVSQKYLEVGIAEQNMIGIASGLSSENFKVVTTTFAPFQTMRCCEQIKVHSGYMGRDICMVGLASGVVLGTLGYTHCCIEDISIMRSIPGITILSPADSGETAKAINAALNYNKPTYIRLSGGTNNPIVYKNDYDFKISKGVKLEDGKDIAIIATGTMVHKALEARKKLKEQKIDCSVTNIHTISPIDKDLIEELAMNSKLLVSIEEHNIQGGLGTAISEINTKLKNSAPQLFIGIPPKYSEAGDYHFLLDKFGLTSEKITEKIFDEFSKRIK
tara:strand:- start:7631 stop:8608 length:978 start_codon:yes stop_codon:yes gene_type:complete